MIFKETCFYCGMPMVNGVCPECGYQYPFAFDCPYCKGITCILKHKTCNKSEYYMNCKLFIKSQLKH